MSGLALMAAKGLPGASHHTHLHSSERERGAAIFPQVPPPGLAQFTRRDRALTGAELGTGS